MMQQRAIPDYLSILLLIMLSGCCTMTGRKFLEQHTGVAISKDISVCNTGVSQAESCQPQDTGGPPWVSNTNFPSEQVAPKPTDDPYAAIATVRRIYLGSPYYNGDLHQACKGTIQLAPLVPKQFEQYFDLSAQLTKTSVSDVTATLTAKLTAHNIPLAGTISDNFRQNLSATIAQLIQSKFVWFVERYEGGKQDMLKDPTLVACLKDLNTNGGKDGKIVTGVAGFVILENKTDAQIADSSTISNALDATVKGNVPTNVYLELQGDLAATWRTSVEKVAKIKVTRNDLTTIAYPLWIQFE